ncbi:sugar ABC transporter permease [Devosia riboflavina]|uniref:Sugar ABC transporter permease n=1 Tax=Devosia riboflavina TaxID=46914 RepID=A0A087LZG2_9HYPH|nr:sugar ABC transporter permease [Devosia riboflavina]KFL30015.1 sugar ABC transporter permease [Devosia riboflavina]
MTAERRRNSSPLSRRSLWIAFLLAPAAVIMMTFVVWPLMSALQLSFFRFEGLTPGDFVWFENFNKVLFQSPFREATYNALWHNIVVFFALMVLENGLALLIAYALLKELPGHRVHQVIVFLPVVLSAVIVAFLWKLLLHPLFGVVNAALGLFGIMGPAWLGSEPTALGSIVFANVWHWMGFPTLVLLAGMQRISREVLEAARLDGAGDWTILTKIVWPLIAPSVTIVTVLTFIGSFNWFELPLMMADMEGSPGRSTDVLALYFYRTAFGSVTSGIQDFGQGSALAVLMFLFVGAVTVVALKYLRSREIEI